MDNIDKSNGKIVTRFAPSPTGFLHIGGVRTALFSYLYSKHFGGKFVLRIEDTDKERSKEEWTTELIDDIHWLGLGYDTFAKQSERSNIYKKYLNQLIDSGHAYISKEEPTGKDSRKEVIRFKNPNKKVVFTDLVREVIEVDTTDLGDFVIAKSIDEPVYHFAVVVDDFEMGITHVIRAEEHLSNTPRQILIQEALGIPLPIYAHLPLVLAEDRSKLSKRKHGESVSLTYYREHGYLPEAIINFVAMVGWNPGTDEEIFSLTDLISIFDIAKVQKGGAIFNIEKLNWYNKFYLSKLTTEQQVEYVKTFVSPELSSIPRFGSLVDVIMERISSGTEIQESEANGEYFFYTKKPTYTKEDLVWKKGNIEDTITHLKYILQMISTVDNKKFSGDEAKSVIWSYAEEKGKGDVLWPMRYCLSGLDRSPDPFLIADILGQEEAISRIMVAIELLEN